MEQEMDAFAVAGFVFERVVDGIRVGDRLPAAEAGTWAARTAASGRRRHFPAQAPAQRSVAASWTVVGVSKHSAMMGWRVSRMAGP